MKRAVKFLNKLITNVDFFEILAKTLVEIVKSLIKNDIVLFLQFLRIHL